MAFTKIWVHAVWSTKHRQPLLARDIREHICQHILLNAYQKGFRIAEINSYTEHLHCLMCLHPDNSIARQMQLIKGESSYWINKNRFFPSQFAWADEYYAASVSDRSLGIVKNYIRNQEIHHQRLSFTDECNNFLRSAGMTGSGAG